MNEPAPLAPPTPVDRRRRILRERAARLAEPPVLAALPEGLPVTCFTVAGARYAVETACVSEVFLLDEITAIPGAPSFLAGVANRRGLILALLDLKALLGLPIQGITDIHAVIVLRGNGCEVGLLADQLLGSARIPVENMLALPGTRSSEYLRGTTSDGLALIDAHLILSDDRLLLNDLDAAGGGRRS